MKGLFTILAAATLVVTLAGAASANQTGIDQRQGRQGARIHQGVRDGDLTRREGRRLRNGQRRIHRVEQRRWADGRLTWRERARLHRMLNRQNHRIYQLRHNGRGC